MSCLPLAGTGEPVLAMIGLGVATLLVGVALLLLTRRRRAALTGAATVLLIACGAFVALSSDLPVARADAPDCTTGPGSPTGGDADGTAFLTVAQTSTMTGLAPGIDPVDITGVVTNTGTAERFVVAVTVRITGVVAVHAGPCSVSDYLLLDVVMPVGRTLEPHESAEFTGARIGFRTTAGNQDACQNAVVDLRYVAS